MLPIRAEVRTRRYPLVTRLIVLVNIAVFITQIGLPPAELQRLFHSLGVVPADYQGLAWLTEPQRWLALLSSQFIHGGWLHILMNMWILWVFGDHIEDRMGPLNYLIFYLLCGALAAGMHIWIHPGSSIPIVGASGAISGVLGAYLLLLPAARVLVLIPIFFLPLLIYLPAILYLVLWFVLQFVNATLAVQMGDAAGVAWWAHVGGFVAGMVLCPLFLAGHTHPRRGTPRRR